MKKAPTILEAPDIVAFILCTSGKQPQPFLRQSDRKVCFRFDEDISHEIEIFYRNVPIPIADFCKNLKLIRSMIFTLKAGNAKWEAIFSISKNANVAMETPINLKDLKF